MFNFKKDVKKIFSFYFSWRILLFIFLYIAIKYLPHSGNFLGGGLKSYQINPYFWAWSNFDGEHYLSIAQHGYKNLQYFFFPLYPLLINLFSFTNNLSVLAIISQSLSTTFFILGLIGLYKLTNLDFKRDVSFYAILLLFCFPTSFYFISSYTESLFLMLAVWSFYFARKGRFLEASLLASLSTATRIIGLAVVTGVVVEYLVQNRRKLFTKKILGLLILPLGIIFYMIFLKNTTGNYFEFFNTIGIFGEQRSTSLVLFPQVFYRYIFKILPNINYSYFLSFFSTWLEFASATLFLGLLVVSIKNLRPSYSVYLIIGYTISTLSGSFSSLPRYVLILFPGFIAMSIYFSKFNKYVKTIIMTLLFVLLGISTAFFARGYWIS